MKDRYLLASFICAECLEKAEEKYNYAALYHHDKMAFFMSECDICGKRDKVFAIQAVGLNEVPSQFAVVTERSMKKALYIYFSIGVLSGLGIAFLLLCFK